MPSPAARYGVLTTSKQRREGIAFTTRRELAKSFLIIHLSFSIATPMKLGEMRCLLYLGLAPWSPGGVATPARGSDRRRHLHAGRHTAVHRADDGTLQMYPCESYDNDAKQVIRRAEQRDRLVGIRSRDRNT